MHNASRTLLWGLVALGLLAALVALLPRIQAERANRAVDLVLDYYGLEDFCQAEGLDSGAALRQFRQAGITSLAYSEQLLPRLLATGRVNMYVGKDLLRAIRSHQEPLPAGVASVEGLQAKAGRLYLALHDARAVSPLQQWLSLVLGPDRVSLWPTPGGSRDARPDHPVVLEVSTSEKALQATGIGFTPTDLEFARENDLGIWLRPENRAKFGAQDVQRYLEAVGSLEGRERVRGFIFEGQSNEVLGFPDCLDATVEGMRRGGLLFGNIEVPVVDAAQKGSQTLGLKLTDQTVRVMSFSGAQQLKMTPLEAVDKFELGVRERNIRVLYLRLFTNSDPGKSPLDTNLDYVRTLSASMTAAGHPPSQARPFPPLHPPSATLILATVGAAAAGLLVLGAFLSVRPWLQWAVLALAVITPTALVAAGRPSLWAKLAALEAALVFPVLGMVLVLSDLPQRLSASSGATALGRGALALVVMTLVSVAGGVYVAGLLASTPFLLAVDQFRGIKLIMLAVPVVVLFHFVTRSAPRPERLTDLLERRVVFWHLGALAVLAGAAVFYIARTGNTAPGAASDLERNLRTVLENVLIVRPRFKEFALAWPAWMMACLLVWRRRGEAWLWLLVLAAAIGQADVIDTFCHIHTPFLISALRVFNGLWMGMLVSAITVGLILWWWSKGDREAPPRTHDGSPVANGQVGVAEVMSGNAER